MSGRQTEADRLRLARRIFERAMADNVTMAEAKRCIAAEARAAADQRRHLRTRAIEHVGRWSDVAAMPHIPRPDQCPPEFAPQSPPIPADDSNDGLKWFQR